MGWASYLEDILNRLGEDLRGLEASLKHEGWTSKLEAEAASLLRRCEGTVHDILTHWNHATDPDLDLAHELAIARQERARARADLIRAEETINQLKSDVQAQKAITETTKGELREARREQRRLEKKLVSTFEADPGKVYDMYAPRPNTTPKKRRPKL